MGDRQSTVDLAGYVPFPGERVRAYREAGYWRDLAFHDVLDRAGEQDPEKAFAVGPHGETSYAEAIENTERIAAYLVGELGLEPLDMVAVQLTNRIEFLEFFFACSRVGVVPVMVLPRHREAEARHVVELTDARAYVTLDTRGGGGFDYAGMVDDVAGEADGLEHLLAVSDGGDVGDGGDGGGAPDGWISYSELLGTDWTREHGHLVDAVDVDPNAPGVMLLSGGTTGMPKGIPRTHNDYVFQWERLAEGAGIEEDWTVSTCVPIGHNASLNPMVGATVFEGATFALEPVLKTRPLLERIVGEDVDYFFAVPTQLIDVLEFEDVDDYDLSGVTAVLSGGQKVRPRAVYEFDDRWGIGFMNVFGMAEGPIIVTRPNDDVEVQAETVGRPIAPDGDEFRIVDERRENELPPGTPGELAARGAGVFTGYFRNPEENAENFDEDGWFYTEDVLELGEDGNYRVHGRLKDTIIRGGENVYAPGVEDELIEHPKVENVAVVGMPDERLGERVAAYVELEAGVDSLSLAEVVEFLDERGVAVFKRPERLEVVESLPRTEVGKISKADLRERITERLKSEGELPADY